MILVDSLAEFVNCRVVHESSSDQAEVVVENNKHVIADGVVVRRPKAREYSVYLPVAIGNPFVSRRLVGVWRQVDVQGASAGVMVPHRFFIALQLIRVLLRAYLIFYDDEKCRLLTTDEQVDVL